jgi:hypothetical protein
MKVSRLYLASVSGKLTCSEVMQILMDQPTQPQDRKIESHAHMHTMEGFKPRATGFSGDAFSLERKQFHYENPTHLYPAGTDVGGRGEDFGRWVGSPSDSYKGTFQDPDRLPPTREYADRTGLPELPKLTGPVKYRVFRKVPRGRPIPEEKNTMAEVNLLTSDQYDFDRNGKIKCVEVPAQVFAPMVKASPAHSMFTDSESMVMHLTAALLSNAGRTVIHHLTSLPAGGPTTVGIFSKSAVRAVNAADTSVHNKMIERRLEVDTTAARDGTTGRYPSSGKVLTATSDIDHIEVILGKRLSGDLNVITCYPSKATTAATIGTGTAADEDIAELALGKHTKVKQVTPIKLTW